MWGGSGEGEDGGTRLEERFGGPQCGVDFEVDGAAFPLAVGKPGAQVVERDEVDADLLAVGAAAGSGAGEVGGEVEVGELAGHPGGGGGGEQFRHACGMVAGFLEEFAPGGFGEGFAAMGGFVADETGGDFDDGFLDGDAELLDENHFAGGSDGEDADTGLGVGALDKVPVADAIDAEPGGFEEGFYLGHTECLPKTEDQGETADQPLIRSRWKRWASVALGDFFQFGLGRLGSAEAFIVVWRGLAAEARPGRSGEARKEGCDGVGATVGGAESPKNQGIS